MGWKLIYAMLRYLSHHMLRGNNTTLLDSEYCVDSNLQPSSFFLLEEYIAWEHMLKLKLASNLLK